jgi:hypothetical protein
VLVNRRATGWITTSGEPANFGTPWRSRLALARQVR